MIFNPSHTSAKTLKPVDITGWKLGILNLEPEDNNDLPFPAQHYEAQSAFGDKTFSIQYYLVEKILCNQPKDYKSKANPTIFSHKFNEVNAGMLRKASIRGKNNIKD